MLTMALYYLWFKMTKPFKKDKLSWGLEVQRYYTYMAMMVFSTKHSVEGQLYDGPALYVSNHRSLLDPVIIRHHINALGVAKAEVEAYPILGGAVRESGVIFVKREDRNSRAQAKDAIVDHLLKGYSILLFPEGTVSGELLTLPFKRGSFEKAVEAGVPVIPITLIYNDPKYHWFDISMMEYYFNSFGIKTPNVHMVIGQPILATTANESLTQAQSQINAQLQKHAN